MSATTWEGFKKKRPLTGKAKAAYERERTAMKVGYLVLTARSEAQLSQSQLARAIGTSQPTVARWESGAQVPSVTSMLKIAEATGFELAVGLHKPSERAGKFTAIEILGGRRRPKTGAA